MRYRVNFFLSFGDKKRKQPTVVISQQEIFYNIVILRLQLGIIERSDQGI